MNIKRFNQIKASIKIGSNARLSDDITITITSNNHHLYCLLIEAIERAETINNITNDEYIYLCDKANCLIKALHADAKELY